MTESDFKRFSRALGTLAEVHDKKMSPTLIKTYFSALSKLNIVQVEKAISRAITSTRFFPKPVELIELAVGAEPQIEDKALVEAGYIIAHLQRHGAHVYPAIEDPITKYLMSRRWPYQKWASQILDAELKWWEKEFCDAYRAHSAKDHAPEIEGQKLRINYGFDRVRFPAPVPAGAKIRMTSTLKRVEIKGGMIEQMSELVVEVQGQEKPA